MGLDSSAFKSSTDSTAHLCPDDSMRQPAWMRSCGSEGPEGADGVLLKFVVVFKGPRGGACFALNSMLCSAFFRLVKLLVTW